MKTLSQDVRDRPILGVGLTGSTLREEVANETTLFVFLRHFG